MTKRLIDRLKSGGILSTNELILIGQDVGEDGSVRQRSMIHSNENISREELRSFLMKQRGVMQLRQSLRWQSIEIGQREGSEMNVYYREPFEYEVNASDIGSEWYSPETRISTWKDDMALLMVLLIINAWLWF